PTGIFFPPTAGSQGGPFFPGFSNLTAPGFGSFLMESNSNSNYNSLQATLNKRFSHGLQMRLSYTWSHSLDYYSGSDVSDVTLSQETWSMNRATTLLPDLTAR